MGVSLGGGGGLSGWKLELIAVLLLAALAFNTF